MAVLCNIVLWITVMVFTDLLWRMTGEAGNWAGGRHPSTALLWAGMKPGMQPQMGFPPLLTMQSVLGPHGEGWQGLPGSWRFLLYLELRTAVWSASQWAAMNC